MRRRREENGLKDKEEKPKSRRRKTLHYGSVPVYILQQTHGGSGRSTALHPNARSTGGSACVSVPQSSVSTPFGRALRFAPRHFGDIIGGHFAMRQRWPEIFRRMKKEPRARR
jgi:hypothetical protein